MSVKGWKNNEVEVVLHQQQDGRWNRRLRYFIRQNESGEYIVTESFRQQRRSVRTFSGYKEAFNQLIEHEERLFA